jgi:hypothetical protein
MRDLKGEIKSFCPNKKQAAAVDKRLRAEGICKKRMFYFLLTIFW